MVQLSALFNTLSKNISSRRGNKKNRLGVLGREAASDLAKEAKRNELLLTSSGVVSARNHKNFAAACSKRGKKGFNQDCLVVWEEFGCQDDMVFCGVFDGHGPWGHLVSKTVRELMPSSLLCHWQEAVALNAQDTSECSLGQEHVQFDIWKQSYYRTCGAVDQEIQHHSGIDSFYSGSTALALLRQGDLLTIANVGDSRAVLATVSDDGSLVATQLTVDLKPNLPCESKRIAHSRGRVYSCPDEPGLHRVWIPHGETVKGPGLAVSRALGDYYIKDFGLISEPEITERKLSRTDEFAILASDGVWDVISNEEAVGIVASTQERGESAKRLVECAVRGWQRRGKAAVMDDISVICLFFHHSTGTGQVLNDNKLNKKCLYDVV